MEAKKKTKEYSNGELTIVWEPGICAHSEICINCLPEVYNPYGKPWITIEKATTEQLKEQLVKCPSGALSYYMNNEGKKTETAEVRVEVKSNGPLIITGALEVIDANGKSENKTKKTAFCRCGGSSNKPYCDGTHAKIEFEG
jgi:uncharacterized Fe-S cluster protein YjdI